MNRHDALRGQFALGLLAALATAVITAGCQVATRLGATTSLSPLDIALIRYSVPAFLLLPLWARSGLVPRSVKPIPLAVVIAGAGLPFGLVAFFGAQLAPVAHMGALIPGAMPLFVATAAWLFLGETLSAARLIGFALIVTGIAAVGMNALTALGPDTALGDLFFLGAAMLWAAYTVAYRRSGLTPWQAAALINAWSSIGILPIWGLSGASRLADAPVADIATQVLWQGLLAGVTALWAYGFAISRIGAGRSAVFGALVPVLAALGGLVVLGERLEPLVWAGVAAAALGVALSTGIFDRKC